MILLLGVCVNSLDGCPHVCVCVSVGVNMYLLSVSDMRPDHRMWLVMYFSRPPSSFFPP